MAACGGDAGTDETSTIAGASETTASTGSPQTTAAPAPTTTAGQANVGTRSNPVPPGTSVSLAGYEVRVVSWAADATAAVLDHNQFNDPPPEGSVYTLIRLAVTYTGDGSGTPWVDLTWRGLGSSNVASEPGECYTYPDDLYEVPEMFAGGSAEGNICLTVLESDLDGLVLMLEETFSFDDTRVFMSLP